MCVFGGYNEVNFWLSSIECFDAATYFHGNQQVAWEIIELKYLRFKLDFTGRSHALMAPIGPEEILIFGGNHSKIMG